MPSWTQEMDLARVVEDGNLVYLEPAPPDREESVLIHAQPSTGPATGALSVLNSQYWETLGASVTEWVVSATLRVGEEGVITTLATTRVEPETVQLRRGARWITLRIEPPEGSDVRSIDPATVHLVEISGTVLDPAVPAESNPKLGFVQNIEVTDLDDDGLPEGMVKFLWSDVKDLLEPGLNDLTCAGQFVDGQRFVAKGSVQVVE